MGFALLKVKIDAFLDISGIPIIIKAIRCIFENVTNIALFLLFLRSLCSGIIAEILNIKREDSVLFTMAVIYGPCYLAFKNEMIF